MPVGKATSFTYELRCSMNLNEFKVNLSGWIDGSRPTVCDPARLSAGPALGTQQPHATLQA